MKRNGRQISVLQIVVVRKNNINDDTIDVEAKGQDDYDGDASSTSSSSSPEVWGEDAKIVQDYEGRSIVVDGLSRTVIEYKGSNNTIVQAYVVGSRDSLRKFLRGGSTSTTATTTDNNNGQQHKTEDNGGSASS